MIPTRSYMFRYTGGAFGMPHRPVILHRFPDCFLNFELMYSKAVGGKRRIRIAGVE
jgi:hypothetical protein